VKLRAASEADRSILFEWTKEAVTREMSFASAPVTWEEHCGWFASKLSDPRCHLLIVCDDEGMCLGQIRFDLQDDRSAIVSVSIASEFRGQGHGTCAVKLASGELLRRADVQTIHALIKPDNHASAALFRRAGYSKPVTTEHKGQPVNRMSL
jgi:UDP-2,4-diacetamido-2,4,6-trideoxy-beta-L-altropyranose hydrolase